MAIYNNGFPTTYPQIYPQYQQLYQQPQGIQTQQNPQMQQNGIIWIQGLQAAKSFLIAPNTTIPLFDTETQSIYLKSADASGMPSLKILDYTIREQNQNSVPTSTVNSANTNLSEYVLKAEFDDLKARFDDFLSKRGSKTTKKEESLNE